MAEQKKNGIPQKGPDTGNYWCTWDTQFRVNSVEDGKDTKNLRNVLTQDFLFAEDGMLRNYFKNVRQDLYVLLICHCLFRFFFRGYLTDNDVQCRNSGYLVI